MFERDYEGYSCALFQDIKLQIKNSSLDVEYTGDELHGSASSLDLRQLSEPEIVNQVLLDEWPAEKELK